MVKGMLTIRRAQMKKSKLQRLTALLLAAVVAFGTFVFSTGNAYAAGCELSLDDVLWKYNNMEISYGLFVHDANWNEKTIVKAKCSPTSVATIDKHKYEGEYWWGVTPKKTGKVKVTVTYKTKSGNKTVSKTVRVKNYPKQIKSLKVNGKAISMNKYPDYYSKKYTGTSVTVKTALKSGWKITSVYCFVTDKNGKSKDINVSKSAVLKGKAIKFAKKYKEFFLGFEMTNTANGDSISYGISLNR